jgi:hypothetical protein
MRKMISGRLTRYFFREKQRKLLIRTRDKITRHQEIEVAAELAGVTTLIIKGKVSSTARMLK